MKRHEWTAIFTVSLTDKEAAQAYTFDYHGKRVVASKLTDDKAGKHGGVDVGCYICEQQYQIALNKPCTPDNTIKEQP